MSASVLQHLGDKAKALLDHRCTTIPKESLHLPGPDFIDRIYAASDRNNRVLNRLAWLFHHGRLSGSGYLSILPVDQGIEHSAGASFAPNPAYFDPENIVKLAMEGGCNAVASTFGVFQPMPRTRERRSPVMRWPTWPILPSFFTSRCTNSPATARS